MLEAEHLAFAYGKGAQTYDFSFEAEAGSITAISGASGSGKSTLLDLIAGFLTPKSGTLTLEKDSEAQALFNEVFAAWAQ